MKKIVFENAHRQKHFDFFNGMNHPHFNITANVDITDYLSQIKAQKLPLSISLVHALATVAHNIKEFRWRIRENEVVEHNMVRPSFTVPTEEAEVFSFCTVPFKESLADFIAEAQQRQEAMKRNPSMEDEAGHDDYLFMSAIPWVSFTGIQHAMSYHPHDSVPRISWGKFFEQNGRIMMPLSLQAHHALVDGSHMGKFFNLFENIAKTP